MSEELPDLRLPVESFEQFCLLLEKDETTINTVLDSKRHEIIKIKPFADDEWIEIGLFNDINVLFGSKGTGKSEILKSISTYYNSNGLKTSVYESSVENLNDCYDIKGKTLKLDLDQLGIQSCSNEIEFIKKVSDESLTLLSNYERYFSTDMNNKRANAISIKNYDTQDTVNTDRKLNEINEVYNSFSNFSVFLNANKTFNEIVSPIFISKLKELIEDIGEEIVVEQEVRFIGAKSLRLYNNLIKVFNDEIAKKTGTPAKPNTTGFQVYARKRMEIEQSVKKVINSIDREISMIIESVGDLDEKGTLDFLTEVIIQTGNINNGNFETLRNVNKTPQKEFVKKIREIAENVYKNDLFEKITELSSLNEVDKIRDIDDLMMFNRYFAINGKLYKPSNGESSMVLLHKELSEEKDIYLLDEPEKSLGNDYINDIIVPLLKERAKMGKIIILATHDANIAVRTLPYNTIYRKHDIDKYSTYIGNPFSNNLVRTDNHQDKMSWKEISMKTLEGGREAFGERGKIYGN